MKEELEANQREMNDMEKSWEEKLKEAKELEEAEEKRKEDERKAILEGTPHVVNLNEDAMLDRTVIYDIKDVEMTCGRRGQGQQHKIQLGGTGI